jgi:hypothetical protein
MAKNKGVKMKTVKAELWQLYVTEGVMGMVHNQYFPINEYYIPKYKISFNVYSNDVNVFYSKDRYKNHDNDNINILPDVPKSPNPSKIEDVKIPESFAKDLKKYLDLKAKIKKDAAKAIKQFCCN